MLYHTLQVTKYFSVYSKLLGKNISTLPPSASKDMTVVLARWHRSMQRFETLGLSIVTQKIWPAGYNRQSCKCSVTNIFPCKMLVLMFAAMRSNVYVWNRPALEVALVGVSVAVLSTDGQVNHWTHAASWTAAALSVVGFCRRTATGLVQCCLTPTEIVWSLRNGQLQGPDDFLLTPLVPNK